MLDGHAVRAQLYREVESTDAVGVTTRRITGNVPTHVYGQLYRPADAAAPEIGDPTETGSSWRFECRSWPVAPDGGRWHLVDIDGTRYAVVGQPDHRSGGRIRSVVVHLRPLDPQP